MLKKNFYECLDRSLVRLFPLLNKYRLYNDMFYRKDFSSFFPALLEKLSSDEKKIFEEKYNSWKYKFYLDLTCQTVICNGIILGFDSPWELEKLMKIGYEVALDFFCIKLFDEFIDNHSYSEKKLRQLFIHFITAFSGIIPTYRERNLASIFKIIATINKERKISVEYLETFRRVCDLCISQYFARTNEVLEQTTFDLNAAVGTLWYHRLKDSNLPLPETTKDFLEIQGGLGGLYDALKDFRKDREEKSFSFSTDYLPVILVHFFQTYFRLSKLVDFKTFKRNNTFYLLALLQLTKESLGLFDRT